MAALRKPTYINNSGTYQEMSLDDLLQLSRLNLTGDPNGIALDCGSARISSVGTPTQPTDAANKQYVDSIAQGLNAKASCRVNVDANVALTGVQTVQSISLAAGDRVLLTGQTDPKQNGIWQVQSGAWTRPADFQSGATEDAAYTFIEEGAYASQGWVCTTPRSTGAIVDTNGLSFTQYSGTGEISLINGSGLYKNGNSLGLHLSNGIVYDGSGLAVKNLDTTISVVAGGIGVANLNNNTPVGGVATTGFTAANLNTLTNGSYADALHKHATADHAGSVSNQTGITGTQPAAGTPLTLNTSGAYISADAAAANTANVVGIQGTNSGQYISHGLAAGVLTSATPNTEYFLAVGGGLTTNPPTAPGQKVVKIGYAINPTDLFVNLQDIVTR